MPGLNSAIVCRGGEYVVRFIHTADWQLGLKLRYLQPERAAQMRLIRFQTVRSIAAVAKSRQADFVLVAGDVLDDNGLGPDNLQQTTDALRSFGELPVGLLPGNHDAATADSALMRLELPPGVRVLAERTPIRFGDALIYPCPLQPPSRNGRSNTLAAGRGSLERGSGLPLHTGASSTLRWPPIDRPRT